jgi:hypothetical protein
MEGLSACADIRNRVETLFKFGVPEDLSDGQFPSSKPAVVSMFSCFGSADPHSEATKESFMISSLLGSPLLCADPDRTKERNK